MALDTQRTAVYRRNMSLLDARRTLKSNLEAGMAPEEANKNAGFSEAELASNMQALQGVRHLKPGFSGAGPEEICTRYAIGEISREKLLDELSRWQYNVHAQWHPYHEFRFFMPGSYDELVMAFYKNFIDTKELDDLAERGLPLTTDLIDEWAREREFFNHIGQIYRNMFLNAGSDRRAYLVVGAPGSGKSEYIASTIERWSEDYVMIDPELLDRSFLKQYIADGWYDAMKPEPAREFEAQGNRLFPMDISVIAREDSAKLGSILLSSLADEGKNIIIETTFTPGFVAQQVVDYLGRNGYEIKATRLNIDKQHSIERCQSRYEREYQQALTQGPQAMGAKPVDKAYIDYVFENYSETNQASPEQN